MSTDRSEYGENLIRLRQTVKKDDAIAAYRRVLRLIHLYMRRNLNDTTLVIGGAGMMTWGELRHHIKCALAMRIKQ